MSKVNPFQAIRFNPDAVGNLADVISPPYDKIPPELRRELWDRHENNIVKVILPPPSDSQTDIMTQSTGDESGDWYSHAAKRFQEWQDQGVLTATGPALYIYHQTYPYEGATYTRSGLYVALRLEDGGGAHAHEQTFEGPKADRLRLTKATEANMSPIFLLADGNVDSWSAVLNSGGECLIDFTDHEGQIHKVTAIQGAEAEQAQALLDQCAFVIADGHHRYETAQNYRREMIEKTGLNPDEQPWGYVFAVAIPIGNPGLQVLPTHRVVSELPENWLDALNEQAASHFVIEEIADISQENVERIFADPKHDASILAASKHQAFLFTKNPGEEIPGLANIPGAVRNLNVSILHHYVFADALGLGPDQLQGNVRYIRGESNAIGMVRGGDYQGAFLLKGIPAQDVFDISLNNVRMPQKSTDFYPKIPTGLLIRSVKSNG